MITMMPPSDIPATRPSCDQLPYIVSLPRPPSRKRESHGEVVFCPLAPATGGEHPPGDAWLALRPEPSVAHGGGGVGGAPGGDEQNQAERLP